MNVGLHCAADVRQGTKEVDHVVFGVVPPAGKKTNTDSTLQGRFTEGVVNHRPKPEPATLK